MASNSVIDMNPDNGPGQRNRLIRGLFTKHFVLLPGEDESQFLALLSSLEREHIPATPTERQLVREMAESQWRLARVGRLESDYLAGSDVDVDTLLKWDRLTNNARRAYRAAMNDLYAYRRARNSHIALSPNPEIEDAEPTYNLVLPPPPEPLPEPLPEASEPEPVKVPYPFAMELKTLKRIEPRFDPTRSRKMSVRLREFCKDQYNLEAVMRLLPTI